MMTNADQRKDSYIPARLGALLNALAAERGGGGAQFAETMRIVSAIFHYEAHAKLEGLRDLYFTLDPDRSGDLTPASGALDAFELALVQILAAANFEETPYEVLGQQAQAHLLNDLRLKTSEAGIKRIRFFSRGAHTQSFAKRRLLGKRAFDAEILDDVVLIVALEETFKRRIASAHLRPGAVMLKHFRNVARHDLAALHPGARPTMKRRDQLFLGVPALAGGAPLLMQLGTAIPVIFTVLAAYFGARGVIDDSDMKKALAAVSGIVALGGFMMRQWVKYQRQTLLYQKKLSDTVYFHNAANNSGVLYGLVAAAEEQDIKEAALAYYALLAGGAMDKQTLDRACETFLRERLNFAVDFEIQDALGKLIRLNLVAQDGEQFSAIPLAEALKRLDEAWDNIFKYAAAG
jgi:hypothetical protein